MYEGIEVKRNQVIYSRLDGDDGAVMKGEKQLHQTASVVLSRKWGLFIDLFYFISVFVLVLGLSPVSGKLSIWSSTELHPQPKFFMLQLTRFSFL